MELVARYNLVLSYIGYGGLEGGVVVLSVMLETLFASGLSNLVLDLSHVNLVRGMLTAYDLSDAQAAKLLELYNTKDLPELDECFGGLNIEKQ